MWGDMTIKCPCNICGKHIEFESDFFQRGTTITCPHCEMETLLFIPPSHSLSPAESKPTTKTKLINCADCGKEVSPRAVACPHCGAPINPAAAPSQTAYAKKPTGLLTKFIAGFIILLLISFIFSLFSAGERTSSVGGTKEPNFRSLNFQSTYFDVIRELGNPDKEIEERDVPMPNVVLGYAREKWIVYVVYDKQQGSVAWNFDKEKSHYLCIINTKGTVIHVADEKMRPLVDGLAAGIRN